MSRYFSFDRARIKIPTFLEMEKKTLLFLLLAGFGIMLVNIIIPLFSKVFFDVILGLDIYRWGPWFATLFCTTIVLFSAFAIAERLTLFHWNTKMSIRQSAKYLWHILRLPLQFYQHHFGGEIADRLSLNDSIGEELTVKLAPVFLNILFILFYAWIMLWFSISIALIGILAVVIHLAVLYYTKRSSSSRDRHLQESEAQFLGFLIGGIDSMETIKSIHGENAFFTKLSAHLAKILSAKQMLGKRTYFLRTLPELLFSLTNTALFAIGGYLIIFEGFTLGLFMAMQALLSSFMTPVAQWSELSQVSARIQTNISRLNHVLKSPIDPIFSYVKKSQENLDFKGHLELRNVTFGYSPHDPPFIENFHLSLQPGQRIALVGRSGCGKTTIARLINGLLQPWSGEIFFDGKLRSEFDREQLTQYLTTMERDIFLFSGTIKENLTLFDSSIGDEEMVRATKDAAIHDEILQKPLGYLFPLLEGGTNLSGGQRQRIEIARGFIANPKIILCDDATSILDANTEEHIFRNLRRRGCTSIIAVQRLQALRDCDEIIVLEEGKVVQRGTYDELKNGGLEDIDA